MKTKITLAALLADAMMSRPWLLFDGWSRTLCAGRVWVRCAMCQLSVTSLFCPFPLQVQRTEIRTVEINVCKICQILVIIRFYLIITILCQTNKKKPHWSWRERRSQPEEKRQKRKIDKRNSVCPTGCKAGLGYLSVFMWSGGIWL